MANYQLKNKTPSLGITKHEKVFEQLAGDIRSGRLKPGQALPTEAQLAKQTGFSRNTVRQALANLESTGVVERIRGRGTFVTATSDLDSDGRLLTNAFALIAPQIREGGYPSLIQGFESACSEYARQTIVANSANDVGKQADCILQSIEAGVSGVAMVPTTSPITPSYQVNHLQRSGIPVVLCHRNVEGIKAPSIEFSGKTNGQNAAKAFLQFDHRRIAILYSHHYPLLGEFLCGIRTTYQAAGLGESAVVELRYGGVLTSPNPSSEFSIREQLDQCMSGEDRPTGIFCHNADDGEFAYLHLMQMGLRIPEDVSLLYLGDTSHRTGLAAKISCLAIDEHQIGVRAAHILHEMKTGVRDIQDDHRMVVHATERPGETLGAAASSSFR